MSFQATAIRPNDTEKYTVDVVGLGWLGDDDEVVTGTSVFSTDESGITIIQQNWDDDDTVNTVLVKGVSARAADYELKMRLITTAGRDRTYIINIPVRNNAG